MIFRGHLILSRRITFLYDAANKTASTNFNGKRFVLYKVFSPMRFHLIFLGKSQKVELDKFSE